MPVLISVEAIQYLIKYQNKAAAAAATQIHREHYQKTRMCPMLSFGEPFPDVLLLYALVIGDKSYRSWHSAQTSYHISSKSLPMMNAP